MIKKTASKLILVVFFSLLLTGCQDLPTSLEEIVGWREKFLLPLTVEQLQFYVGDILMAIVIFAGIRGLFGHLQDTENQVPFLEGRLSAALMLLTSAGLIYWLIPTANQLTTNILPADLTIDKLLKDLHLDLLTIDPLKMITQVWAVSFSITLPLLVEYALLSSLVFALAVLMVSSIWQLSKALWVIVSIWLGHVFFVKTFVMVETTLGNTYPAWKLADVGNSSSSFYVGFTLVALAFCYFVIPMVGLFFGPNFVGPRRKHSDKPDKPEKPVRAKADLDKLVTVLIPPSQPPPQPRSASSTPPTQSPPDDDVVDGVYREEPKGELDSGTKFLPGGNYSSPDPEPDSGGSPAAPSPKPPSGSGSPHDPDWVPPIDTAGSPKGPTRKSGPNDNNTPDPAIVDEVITVTHREIKPPRSARITKTQQTINKVAAVTEIGATVLGHPEVAAVAHTVMNTNNTVLGAVVTREKSKEPPAPKMGDPDWVPTITVKGGV